MSSSLFGWVEVRVRRGTGWRTVSRQLKLLESRTESKPDRRESEIGGRRKSKSLGTRGGSGFSQRHEMLLAFFRVRESRVLGFWGFGGPVCYGECGCLGSGAARDLLRVCGVERR